MNNLHERVILLEKKILHEGKEELKDLYILVRDLTRISKKQSDAINRLDTALKKYEKV